MPLSGIAVFYATAGGVLLWSGFKGQTIADTVKAVTTSNQQALTAQGSQSVSAVTLALDTASPSGASQSGSAGGSVAPAASVPTNGSQYSYSQLEGLWILAGGPPSLAPTMAAIAEAESGGRSNAYNPSGASGLWQILGAVNPADQKNLFNPLTNAREAVAKYKTQGLGAWVTYTSGAYKQYLK